MAKFSNVVSSSRRKSRKAHFASDSSSRRKLMSAHLSKDQREKHGVRSMPIRKDDEVKIVRGGKNVMGHEGKVIAVYRKRMCIHVERVTRDKANGTPVQVPIHPSNVVITKLHSSKDRKDLVDRKVAGPARRTGGGDLQKVD